MAEVTLDAVWKHYGDAPVVKGVSLTVAQGEVVSLLGASGSGKTTCLRMVAGFIEPTGGRILLGSKDVTRLPPHRRNTGMVFQSYALFPHKTVAGNVAFGLQVRGTGRAETAARVRDALRLVQLEAFAGRYPSQLSGGQRQRVALARAVVIRPEVLLLDEPLGALDAKLREELQVEIRRVISDLGITTLFVTHDQSEALSLSDRVAVMQDGAIVQIDTPARLYDRPRSAFVANFVGRTNLIPVRVREATAERFGAESLDAASQFTVTGTQDAPPALGVECLLAIRPEHVQLGASTSNAVCGTVRTVTFLGSLSTVDAALADGTPFQVSLRSGEAVPRAGDALAMHFDPARCFLLPAQAISP